MPGQENITFQKVLDVIESLPENQQEDIIKIIHSRIIERKREILAKDIQKAREEFARGEIKKGTVDDLLKEISE